MVYRVIIPWKLHSFLAITGISRSHDRIARETERRTETRARICRKGIRDAEGGPQLGGQRRHVSFVRESHYRAWERLPGLLCPDQNKTQSPLEFDQCRRFKSVNWRVISPMIVSKMDTKSSILN
ncbi:hypothetical protein EAG_10941 [Camponotus floridanus]|uniref:Uncharacterized protein n=1 Tax=Camponotus floridanus TaxID=104421 RepID=E2ALI2_CAMFO|nr:hypothetical protein EAG_10941 [Camponotus floridanus]